ncbi:Carbonic anhydrase, alpha-class, catalytic domain protein [Moelleriella libera RCEF 2490]|uniref:carbonic anhydrase n=1 Tax=Moelleriella libera RCEF 2490 TaxID=1081109 RepID=A0A167YRZ7_9HYPO|nr:Carbonic anhydrase, alpha-class, catalytic domain protein [Moelleriella libera RCEF 2490]
MLSKTLLAFLAISAQHVLSHAIISPRAGGPIDYSDPSGKSWGGLCATGQHQSPIDLAKGMDGVLDVERNAITLKWEDVNSASIENHGPAIYVKGPKGSLSIKKKSGDALTWALDSFHFHTPSEHSFDGKKSEMEVHFVHQTGSGKDVSRAVMGVLIDAASGSQKPNQVLDMALEKALLVKKMHQTEKTGALKMAELAATIQAQASLTYEGSLTTHPCDENVRFFISKTKLYVKPETLKNAKEVMKYNARDPTTWTPKPYSFEF